MVTVVGDHCKLESPDIASALLSPSYLMNGVPAAGHTCQWHGFQDFGAAGKLECYRLSERLVHDPVNDGIHGWIQGSKKQLRGNIQSHSLAV